MFERGSLFIKLDEVRAANEAATSFYCSYWKSFWCATEKLKICSTNSLENELIEFHL